MSLKSLYVITILFLSLWSGSSPLRTSPIPATTTTSLIEESFETASNVTDLSNWCSQNGGAFTYNVTHRDFNLDGIINAIDRNELQKKNT